jgi:hypothetical protein
LLALWFFRISVVFEPAETHWAALVPKVVLESKIVTCAPHGNAIPSPTANTAVHSVLKSIAPFARAGRG